MKILDHRQIVQKIKRLAIEIVEQHYLDGSIILAGINNNGYSFASLLMKELANYHQITAQITRIRLNPANPIGSEVVIELPNESLANQNIIIVDDVANTGRTIFYAVKPLLEIIPKKVEVAVLVDRKHKGFPIMVDYVGLSLATTLMEEITVKIRDVEEYEVFLN